MQSTSHPSSHDVSQNLKNPLIHEQEKRIRALLMRVEAQDRLIDEMLSSESWYIGQIISVYLNNYLFSACF